ncbi:MAG: DUF6259 domain-containing protein [Thiogranum sp.]
MQRCSCVLLTGILLLGLPAGSARASAHAASCLENWSETNTRNPLVNAGFESGFSGWSVGNSPAGVSTTIDTTESHLGAQSVMVSFDGQSESQNYSAVSQVFPVIPGRTYRFGAFIKTENLSCANCADPVISRWNGARIEAIDADNGWQAFSQGGTSVTGTSPWTEVRDELLVPAGTSNIRLRLRRYVGSQSGTSTGTAWWDDIQFLPVPVISTLQASSGQITIDGEGFSTDPVARSTAENCVLYNGSCLAEADILSWSDTRIVISAAGNAPIRVRSGGIVSNAMSLQPDVSLASASLILDFSALPLGGGITQITDVATGRAFVDTTVAEPLYELTVKDSVATDLKSTLSSRDASSISYNLSTTGSEQVLTVTADHCGEFIVTATATLPAAGAARFAIDVNNTGTRVAQSVRYPIVAATAALGSTPDDDAIIIPYLEGYLLRNPAAEAATTSYRDLNYPGRMTLQMTGFYDAEAGAGLYLAMDDSAGYKKRFGFERIDNGSENYNRFSFSHIRPDTAGGSISPPYNVLVDRFQGDWRDAADRYKQWAINQPWTSRTLSERSDTPQWLFDIDAMVDCYRCKPGDYGALVDKYKTMLGVTDLLLYPGGFWGINNGLYTRENVDTYVSWSGVDYFSDNPVYDPASEPASPPHVELKNGIDAIHARNAEGLFFIEGLNWDHYSYKSSSNYPGFDNCDVPLAPDVPIPGAILFFDDRPDYTAYGAPDAVMNENGSIKTTTNWAISKAYQGQHCRLTSTMCVGTDSNHAMEYVLYNNVNRGIDHGARLMSLDALVSGRIYGCWNPAHGHPLGEGRWTHDRLVGIFNRINQIVADRGMSGQFGLAMEDVSELYLQDLQFQYLRHSNLVGKGNSKIPLFNYIYKEYYLGVERGMSLASGNTLGMRWALAMDFVQGNIQGTMTSSDLAFEPDPDLLAYYKRIIGMKRPDFYYGSMQRPPAMTGLLPETTIIQNPDNGSFFIEPVVTNSLRTDANTVSHLLVNVYPDATNPTDITLSLAPGDMPSDRNDLSVIKNGVTIYFQENFSAADAPPVINLAGGDVVEVRLQHWDLDGDTLSNVTEAAIGTDPSSPDTDGDGLTDGEEVNTLGTNPLLADSDGDGYDDDVEINIGSDPLDSASIPPDGDINGDNRVDLADVLLAGQIALGYRTATADERLRGDVAPLVNGVPQPNGVLDAGDLLLIQRKALGLGSF